MQWTELALPGCYTIDVPMFRDARGGFFKTLNSSLIRQVAPDFQAQEAFTTISDRNVLRGMHFQSPPHEHDKGVSISQGRAHDVLVDLRPGDGFGKVCAVEMSAGDTCTVVFAARGVAHGFLALTDACTMNYVTDSEHAPASDMGVLWSSIDHAWPVKSPIISERDLKHPPLSQVRFQQV
jgi:dTDP-4-dehydrorhamnose 3,5-epimerase/CDP-3, 6-dideoxy-D-glycero-D-glycero-4-hexulose-5-epimerase